MQKHPKLQHGFNPSTCINYTNQFAFDIFRSRASENRKIELHE